jgi:hypothetical protein
VFKRFTSYMPIRTLGVLLLVTLFFACKKDEGRGGQATITGKVYAYDVNRNGIRVDSGYMAGVRVYISYGNSNAVDDDTRTSFDGTYSFPWLNKGDYKVWVVSEDCAGCPLNQSSDVVLVNVKDRKETVTVRDLIYNF